MNTAGDFIEVMFNDRENFVNKLHLNYSYEHLYKLLSDINSEKESSPIITPNDKYVYRLMSGKYNNTKYANSSIDWIPSSELIDSIISLANLCEIKIIEEIYTGMGILACLIKKKVSTSNIIITAADLFESIDTCNKLEIMPVAKRSIVDYSYYTKLNEPYPQMVICTKYIDMNQTYKYIDEITDMIASNHHDIIIIICPSSANNIDDILSAIPINTTYSVKSCHIKAVDKYFDVHNILKKYSLGPLIAHIITKNCLINSVMVDKIFHPAIISSNKPNNTSISVIMKKIYDIGSPKLVKSIYQYYNFLKSETSDSNKLIRILKSTNLIFPNISSNAEFIHTIPDYIYDIEECQHWIKFISAKMYLLFDSRIQFLTFYTDTKTIHSVPIQNKYRYPSWLLPNQIGKKYIFIYLTVINHQGDWKESDTKFSRNIKTINDVNKNKIIK